MNDDNTAENALLDDNSIMSAASISRVIIYVAELYPHMFYRGLFRSENSPSVYCVALRSLLAAWFWGGLILVACSPWSTLHPAGITP